MRYFALLLSVLCICSCAKKAPSSQAAKPLFVKVEQASLGRVEKEFETAGELKADKEILVAAERQGKIEQIFVREGQSVRAGDVLIKIEGQDVDADLKKAQNDYQSYQKLYEEGAISKQELINYEALLRRVESQRDNLKIRAISEGVIGVIYVDPGDYVNLGDQILDLVKIYPLRVSYSVPEKLISTIALGQRVELHADSEPGKVFEAKVDFISPRVDPNSRAVLVRARIDNPGSKLKANQFVRVKQIVDSKDAVLLVREEAIYLDQGQEYLYLAESEPSLRASAKQSNAEDQEPAGDDGIATSDSSNPPRNDSRVAKRVAVKTGHRQDGKVEILEGLNEGDTVIYAGLHSIYPGAKLVIVDEE